MPIRFNKRLLMILTSFLLSGCATIHAPPGWLPENAAQLRTEAFGSWIVVHHSKKAAMDQQTKGELIAVSQDSLFVLNSYALHPIALSNITRARLVEYKPHTGELSGWIFLGALSTISHGFWLAITTPVLWILGGTLAESSRSFDPILDYPGHSLSSFRAFARFPQGLPKNINRKLLVPKQPVY